MNYMSCTISIKKLSEHLTKHYIQRTYLYTSTFRIISESPVHYPRLQPSPYIHVSYTPPLFWAAPSRHPAFIRTGYQGLYTVRWFIINKWRLFNMYDVRTLSTSVHVGRRLGSGIDSGLE